MFCLGLRKALWLEHFDYGHVLDSAPIFHSLTAIRISVCNLLFLLQSEFLLLSFLLFWICNPSGHPMKHKSNSSAGELSLDFTICTGEVHFWSWVKIHMPHCLLLILVFEIHLAWSRVSFRRKKKPCHQCLVYSMEAWKVELIVKWLFIAYDDFKDNYLGFTMK